MSCYGVSELIPWLLMAVLLLASPAHSLTCTSQKFTNNKLYDNCNDLPTLTAYLHWSFNSTNSSLSIAFVATPAKSDGWIAWAINPNATGMIGSQALIAFKQENDSMTVNTYNISSYGPVSQSKLSFDVWDLSAELSNGVMTIFAKMAVPKNAMEVNQVWQVGSTVLDGVPRKHAFEADNLKSRGSLNFTSGQQTTQDTGGDSMAKKNIHGILNAISWGILFPIGIIISRYLKTFKFADPAWFYLHVSCQLSAYVLGVAGWGTGLKLGNESKGIRYTSHRNIGIALFFLATLQILALFLRPKKEHKYRFVWNIYHHGVGYAILVLGILNVFKGLDILDPEKKWKLTYVVIIIILGVIALFLEAFTWMIVLRRKFRKSTKTSDGLNG